MKEECNCAYCKDQKQMEEIINLCKEIRDGIREYKEGNIN